MNPVASKVLREALGLSARDRAFLADSMILSLNAPDPTIDQLWADEAEARIDAESRGEMKTVSMEDVFAKYEK